MIVEIKVRFEKNDKGLEWVRIGDIHNGVGTIELANHQCVTGRHHIGECVRLRTLVEGEKFETFNYAVGLPIDTGLVISEVKMTHV